MQALEPQGTREVSVESLRNRGLMFARDECIVACLSETPPLPTVTFKGGFRGKHAKMAQISRGGKPPVQPTCTTPLRC